MDDLILQAFKEWESRGEMTSEVAEGIGDHLDEIVEREIKEIQELIDKKPYVAFAHLTSLTCFLNAAAAKHPLILKKLEKWIKAIKSTLSQLAKKIGAVGFNISVGLPAGVSVSLSFSISP